jgi:hypothetical protein
MAGLTVRRATNLTWHTLRPLVACELLTDHGLVHLLAHELKPAPAHSAQIDGRTYLVHSATPNQRPIVK